MKSTGNRSLIFLFFGILIFLMIRLPSFSQPYPPFPLQVFTVSDINFGAFSQGISGGTVIISPDGLRTTTGDIQQMGFGIQFYPAIFEIEVIPGTVISIIFGPDAVLTGSNGGTLMMHVGGSDPQSPFITTINLPGKTEVRIGGTLIIGNPNANPPGAYSGIFSVTFNQQ
jgi:hypothetical protein